MSSLILICSSALTNGTIARWIDGFAMRALGFAAKGSPPAAGYAWYWMQRAQRAFDNPALEAAIRAANEPRLALVVLPGLVTTHPVANLKYYAFMAEVLIDSAQWLKRRRIGLVVRMFASKVRCGPGRSSARRLTLRWR
jgi:deoxyribodipyrimidine photo-lyase